MKHPIRKKWGQNFLKDKNIQHKIVDLLELSKEDNVLEIGPGYGALTQLISPLVNNLTAIEIDPLLVDELNQINLPNTKIIQKDFLEFNLNKLGKKVKCIGNLPYYITTPILFKVLEWNNWEKCVFMVQKEVALRLTSPPKNKIYGRLTIMAGLFGNVKFEFKVSSNVFIPQPEVESAIISITRHSQYKYSPEFIKSFQEIVKLAFSSRRKVLKNTIKDYLVEPIINKYSKLRPEECSIEDFKVIVNAWFSSK
jgi:16S rRNA (adenine1518-N6/adenine1519-N6)-dimethyltransferase